jgi:flagellar hook-associated protein 1 FlgK
MSITIARSIAYGALMTTQVQMRVTSSNIANADTDGYTRKIANQAAVVRAGVGTGTTIVGISSTLDKLLLKSLRAAASELGAADTTASVTDRLQSLFGRTGGAGTSIASTIAGLEAALLKLAKTPESESLQSVVVDALDALAAQLRGTSGGIQNLRADADDEIETKVQDVNAALHQIDELNDQIGQAAALGQSTADLEDQRNQAIQGIASLMDVNYFVSSNGRMQVYTSSGQALLDGSVHALAYESAGAVTAGTVYSATPPSGFDAIRVDGKDITSHIKSGRIGALIDLRDDVLPAAQSELDELATELADALNAVHNKGTAIPPPASLTGRATVSAADALSATGKVRFAVTNRDGVLVSYRDLDLASYATVGDLVAAIDSIPGLSASINAEGHVKVTADGAAHGIAVNEMNSAVGAPPKGLSNWLGLNDLVTATGASDFAVRSDIVTNKSLLATSTLDSSSSLTIGHDVLSLGSAAIAESLHRALTEPNSFDAAGRLSGQRASFASYAADIVAANATAASRASRALAGKETTYEALADTIASQSGVNLDEETARMAELQNLYEATAGLMRVLDDMFDALLDTMAAA